MGVARREQSTLNTLIMGVDPAEVKRQGKRSKRLAREDAEEAAEAAEAVLSREAAEAAALRDEAKKQRKKSKRLAREAAEEAAETVEAVPAKKKPRKKIKRLARKLAEEFAEATVTVKAAPSDAKEEPAATVEVPPSKAEAKRRRKAAAKLAENAAAPEAAEDEDMGVPVGKTPPKPAAEPAPSTEVAPTRGTEKKAGLRANKKGKRDAQDQSDVVPSAKKSKTETGESSSKEAVHKSDDAFKVFVRGLPWSIDEDALREHFETCGIINDVKMPRTPSGSLRGLAFIKFRTQEGFDAALALDQTMCGGRPMNVAKVEKLEGKGRGKDAISMPKAVSNELTAFIRGLPFSMEENVLRKDFEECGEIEKVTIPRNPEGKPKGICFIRFLEAAGLDAALKFDNTEYGGRTIGVHKAEDGQGGKSKDGKGKGKDGKSKGKDSKGKSKGRDGKSKGKDGSGKTTGKGNDADD